MTDQPPGFQPHGYQPPTPGGGFPSTGYQGFPPSGPIPVQQKRGPLVPLLAVALVVFLAAAGVMLFLWLGAADDAKAAQARLQETETALSGLVKKADDAGKSADDAEAETERIATENTDLEGQIEVMRKCADPVRATLDAAGSGNDAKLRESIKVMIDNC